MYTVQYTTIEMHVALCNGTYTQTPTQTYLPIILIYGLIFLRTKNIRSFQNMPESPNAFCSNAHTYINQSHLSHNLVLASQYIPCKCNRLHTTTHIFLIVNVFYHSTIAYFIIEFIKYYNKKHWSHIHVIFYFLLYAHCTLMFLFLSGRLYTEINN